MPSRGRLLQHLPLALSLTFMALMVPVRTRSFLLPYLRENGPVELLTFGLALLAGLLASVLATRGSRPTSHRLFLALFGLGMLFVAMEEIAWGQTWVDYATPEYFLENNVQEEITIHNLEMFHGGSDYLYTVFGLGGLIGIYAAGILGLGALSVPRGMASLFWTITLLSLLSIAQGKWDFGLLEMGVGRKLAEVLEMWVSVAGFLYVLALRRRSA